MSKQTKTKQGDIIKLMKQGEFHVLPEQFRPGQWPVITRDWGRAPEDADTDDDWDGAHTLCQACGQWRWLDQRVVKKFERKRFTCADGQDGRTCASKPDPHKEQFEIVPEGERDTEVAARLSARAERRKRREPPCAEAGDAVEDRARKRKRIGAT